MNYLEPPPSREIPPARLETRKEALMNEISKERSRPTYRRRHRRMAAILVPAALLATAATSYVVLKADQVVAAGIGCHDAPSLDANVAIVSTTGDNPVDLCTEIWDRGDLGPLGTAPTMTACVNEPGAVLVFPSDEQGLCTRLGLQDLPKDYVGQAKRFADMRDDLEQTIKNKAAENRNCLDAETSTRIAEEILSEHGFDEWRVEVLDGDGYDGRPCANWLGFDDKAKTVQIIPSNATL